MRSAVLAVLATIMLAATAGAATPKAPWQQHQALPQTRPDIHLVVQQWQVAANRSTCAAFAFGSVGAAFRAARPRRAVFAGGWAVAYDVPGHRSAFGVAGVGVVASPSDVTRWPHVLHWSDGSAAGYGLTGSTGPGYLAYVRVKGQRCLYNVWSNVGEPQLVFLLNQLRRVHGAP